MKIIFTVLVIVTLALTPLNSLATYIFAFLFLLGLLLLSRIPLDFVFKRSLVILPFLLFLLLLVPFLRENSGSYNTVAEALNLPYAWTVILSVSLKSWLSALYLIFLSSTTRFPDLLKGLEKLRVPHILILTLSFMYRYVFVFQDEALRMKRARDARSKDGNVLWHISSLGSIIGSLFIRAYERGERVYKAMLARGFNGEIHTSQNFCLTQKDIAFLLLSSTLLLTVRFIWR